LESTGRSNAYQLSRDDVGFAWNLHMYLVNKFSILIIIVFSCDLLMKGTAVLNIHDMMTVLNKRNSKYRVLCNGFHKVYHKH